MQYSIAGYGNNAIHEFPKTFHLITGSSRSSHRHTHIHMHTHTISMLSSIHRHLDCFHVLVIVNNAAMKLGIQKNLFKRVILFPLDIYPEVVLLDHMVVPFLTFWGTFILFSIVATTIYIPTDSAQWFPFLHILTNIYLLSFC